MGDDDEQVPIPFAPVPSRTRRRDGWTEAVQRAFIAALARCGSARAAARQVGKSVRGAYALLDRPGSEGFAEAWDRAVLIGRDATRDCVIDRAMSGAWVPVVRRGRIVRMEYRYFDRLAMAILSGRGRDVEEDRRAAARARDHRVRLREEDGRRAAEAEALEERQRAYGEALEREVKKGQALAARARAPRITIL